MTAHKLHAHTNKKQQGEQLKRRNHASGDLCYIDFNKMSRQDILKQERGNMVTERQIAA